MGYPIPVARTNHWLIFTLAAGHLVACDQTTWQVVSNGFTPYMTPDLVRANVLEKCGFQPRMANTQVYRCELTLLCMWSNQAPQGPALCSSPSRAMTKTHAYPAIRLHPATPSFVCRSEAFIVWWHSHSVHCCHQMAFHSSVHRIRWVTYGVLLPGILEYQTNDN